MPARRSGKVAVLDNTGACEESSRRWFNSAGKRILIPPRLLLSLDFFNLIGKFPGDANVARVFQPARACGENALSSNRDGSQVRLFRLESLHCIFISGLYLE